MTGKPIRFFVALAILLLAARPARGANDSLYFLYQRTTYLENLLTTGGWWANPALTGEITVPTGYTINVTPLGYSYTLASVKYLFPVLNHFGAGIGVMGTGIAPNQSAQFSSNEVSTSSQFTFSNPSFQLGFGGRIPAIGGVGALIDIGEETVPNGFTGGSPSDYLLTRFGLGVLTPYYYASVSVTGTALATLPDWDRLYMDSNAKIGLRVKFLDEANMGSAEYKMTVKSGLVQTF